MSEIYSAGRYLTMGQVVPSEHSMKSNRQPESFLVRKKIKSILNLVLSDSCSTGFLINSNVMVGAMENAVGDP